MTEFIMNLEGVTIPVHILLKRKNKRIKIRISKGICEFTTPYEMSQSQIETILKRHKHFILHHIQNMSNLEKKRSGFWLDGLCYEIQMIEEEKIHYEINELTQVITFYGVKTEKEYICLQQKIYETYLNRKINQYKTEIEEKLRLNFHPTIIIKPIRSAYGINHWTKRIIVLSLFLAKFKSYHLYGVLCHEYAHFFYHDHQKKFHQCLDQLYPDNRMERKKLVEDTKMIKLDYEPLQKNENHYII